MTDLLRTLADRTPDGARLLTATAAFLQSATMTSDYKRRRMWEGLAAGAPEVSLSAPDAEAALTLLAAASDAGDTMAAADAASLRVYPAPRHSFGEQDGDEERAAIRKASLVYQR